MPVVHTKHDLDTADSTPVEPAKSPEQLFEEAVNDALVKLTRPNKYGRPALSAAETYTLSYFVMRAVDRLRDAEVATCASADVRDASAKASHAATTAWAWLQKLAQLEGDAP